MNELDYRVAIEALENHVAQTRPIYETLKAIDYLKKAHKEALAQQCVCGEPNSAGTHRTDGPCLAPQPEYQSTAEKSKLEKVPAKGRLLAQPEQEPVGYWMGEFNDGSATLYEVPQESVFGRKYQNIPVYTTPPQRTWEGLDLDERAACYEASGGNLSKFAAQIEAKLKEKNQ